MDVRWMTGFLDSPPRDASPARGDSADREDPPALGDPPAGDAESFWLSVTGTRLSARRGPDGRFATLLAPGGDAYLRVQVVGAGPPRTHLDLHVVGVPEAAGEAVALGARVTHREDGLVVLRSPAGLAFCLVAWAGEAVLPAPARWPGGQASVVDQVSLDLPEGDFEAEAALWESLTGWVRRSANLPEFDYLERAPGMPLRLLLQRTTSGPARMHLDLACDDVDAEVARHVGLGARVVRRVPDDWTTLRDPVGREYCVTGRSPASSGA